MKLGIAPTEPPVGRGSACGEEATGMTDGGRRSGVRPSGKVESGEQGGVESLVQILDLLLTHPSNNWH